MTDADQKKLWELSQQGAATLEGYVVSINWADRLVEVNVAGVTSFMPWMGPAPWENDRVRVIKAGQYSVAMGVYGAAQGTVQSVASGVAVVLGDDGISYRYPYLGSAPAASARVTMLHASRVVLGGVYSTEPLGSDYTPPYIPPAPPKPSVRKAWFSPAWSGNWSGGTFSGDLAEISDSRVALYGYGTSIANTIPNTSTITRAELYLTENWDRVPGVASSMGTHGFNGRPGSGTDNADLTGSYSVPGLVQDIRGAVADALKNGTALGVGFRSGFGWRQYGAAPGSGRIYMEWS